MEKSLKCGWNTPPPSQRSGLTFHLSFSPPSGSSASAAPHWRLGLLLVHLEGLLRSHRHDNQGSRRSPFQVKIRALLHSNACVPRVIFSELSCARPRCFQAPEGADGLLLLPGERVGGRPARGQEWEGAAAGVEKANPAAEQSQPGHGRRHPGGVPVAAAAEEGTPPAGQS